MKKNENKKIIGSKIILVPYEKKHVIRYHEWMKSEELQQLTASEPLSLEEEYEMQLSWRNDDNKCTFIILNREDIEENGKTEIDAMVGDVNLFFNDEDDMSTAEVEIMIAQPSARGKGIGKEALYTMMRYGVEDCDLRRYTAKIGFSNAPSLNMFNKLGFIEVSRSDVFEEVTFELNITDDVINEIEDKTGDYTIQTYKES